MAGAVTGRRNPGRGNARNRIGVFTHLEPENKAVLDRTADAVGVSKATLFNAILSRLDLNEQGVIEWAHELVPEPQEGLPISA